ncbi:MAG: DUF421 domain-containing protein [Oscillospiraceae bacterium]|nr:YetF domain-containing protein [uncultured Gemmiger sp.]MCI6787198.1 DUF421 domain-containing protein [Oscillospiraceae bacterium]
MISSVVRTVLVYLAVVVAMRLMGKRQLGELQPAELVTTLLISNVASICIDEPDLPLSASLVPIFLITALEILNSTLVWFCPRYAQLLLGKPVTIIRNGEILQKELARLRITAADLAEALRGRDIFSPQEVYWGVVEPNGSITTAVMPAGDEDAPLLPLLIDRTVYRDNLAFFGLDETALDRMLETQNTSRRDVLLLLYNGEKTVLIPKKTAPEGTV